MLQFNGQSIFDRLNYFDIFVEIKIFMNHKRITAIQKLIIVLDDKFVLHNLSVFL